LCIKNYLTVQTKNVNNYPGNRLEDKISSGFSKLYFDNELLF